MPEHIFNKEKRRNTKYFKRISSEFDGKFDYDDYGNIIVFAYRNKIVMGLDLDILVCNLKSVSNVVTVN